FLGAWLGGLVFDLTGSYSLLWEAPVASGLIAAMLHFPIDDTAVSTPPALRSKPANA
ncbi:MAG TPA: MFS transporter, partial [Paraburkholderia sp.]|nr:MFS transporter [Paraburkholderia sp.]